MSPGDVGASEWVGIAGTVVNMPGPDDRDRLWREEDWDAWDMLTRLRLS